MPLNPAWKDYSINSISTESDNYAVFELGDIETNEILYIGYGHLLTSLITNLPLRTNLENETNGYKYQLTNNQNQSIRKLVDELQKFYSQNSRFPRYNKPNDLYLLQYERADAQLASMELMGNECR